MPVTGIKRNRFRRLAQTGWAELRFRSRQELGNRWDGILHRLGADAWFDRRPLVRDRCAVPPRFFFSREELGVLAALVRSRLPEVVEETIERAERICAHRFDLLGFAGLNFGREIDWHLDPVHAKRAPRRLWYEIPYLDFETVGDAKIIWELNRHQHFVTLGKAYQWTGAERFAREFVMQFEHWLRDNPYPVGVNWASSLEVAFRSLSWLWARELFFGSPSLTPGVESELTIALARNARFIERNLSAYFSPNTHLLGEAVALFFIGVLCPELRSASHWRALGWRVLLDQAQRQVRADGGYFEQSTYYHVYALDLLSHARILAARNRIPIPAELDRTLLAMLDYLAGLAVAGPPPRFGDDDGGRVFAPQRTRAEHLFDPLSTGAVLYRRGEFKAAAGGLREETVWLLGSSAASEFDHLSAASPLASSRAFSETGVYLLASPGLRLAIDAGPMGTARGGHAHADALSVCVAADGCEWLGDAGTFTYTGAREWRDSFRGTPAHNTLVVDGLDQSEPLEPFAWSRLPETRVERWLAGRTFDLLVASHDGYSRLASPVRHQRVVFFVQEKFWLVVDRAQGQGQHHLEVFWHSPLPRFELDRFGRALAAGPGGTFALVPVADPEWAVELAEAWWSPNYGVRQRRQAVRCAATASLPAEFATLLVPRAGEFEELGRLERLVGNRRDVGGYRYLTGSRQYFWFMAETTEIWQAGEFASDARVCFCAISADGGLEQAVLCDGTFLALRGARVLEADRRCMRLEYRWLEHGGEAFCSEPSAQVDARRLELVGAANGKGGADGLDWT